MSGRIDVPKKTPQKSSTIMDKGHLQSASKEQAESLNDRVVIDQQGTRVAITVKTKKKDSSRMSRTPGTPLEPENPEKLRKSEPKTNWGGILREQNKTILKQSLHQINSRFSGSKTARPSVQARRSTSVPKALSNPPSSTSLTSKSSQESVIVTDKGIQCGGIFDSSNKDFNSLNPIRTIGFLMKELESCIKDERSCGILFQMEQALLRIPENSRSIPAMDMNTITNQAKLEASVAMLAATTREMQNNVEAMKKEKLTLQHQLDEKNTLLSAANRRETELETVINDLRLKLNEFQHLELTNKKLLAEIKQKNDKIQLLHNLTTELRSELTEQTELAQQRFVEIQFLKMEKEKMSVMSAFKDTQLIEHRSAIKNLQNSIYDQFLSIKESNEHQLTVGRASSSLLHSSTDAISIANEPSFSTILSNQQNRQRSSEISAKTLKSNEESEIQGEKFREKTHLEFVSLQDENSQISLLKPNEDEFIYIVPEKKVEGESLEEKIRKKSEEFRRRGSIKEHIRLMYENTRAKSNLEVKVPSPPRSFPRPDWSDDSSMPTLSISESNVII